MGWGSKNRQGPTGDQAFENILGRSCAVRGDVTAEGGFRVDGTLEGRIESQGAVVIGESGTVRGEVRAREVVIAGKVFGNVTAAGHLDILASGHLEGDIEAKSVRIETGGVFRGTSRMGEESTREPSAPRLTSVS
jgi:cytoskeletal protein CcmA (bactofilin family)